MFVNIEINLSIAWFILPVANPIDINSIIANTIFFVTSQASKKQIELITNFGESEALVYADKNLINQVLVNLVGNAIKYSITLKI